MPAEPLRFLDAGETALVAEFGNAVDPVLHDRVLALDAALEARALSGVRETVPSYRSLMIHYDPLVLERAHLVATLRELAARPHETRQPKNRWIIPCCYDPRFGEDVDEIARAKGLTRERVIALHSGATYRVYMYGFAPGCCYLGGLPEELAIPRRAKPRPPIAPNSVIVGGGLAVIMTVSMPTGWWLVGRTPERLFAMARDPAFLVEVGDMLRFEPIGRAAFDVLEARAVAGEIVAQRERLR